MQLRSILAALALLAPLPALADEPPAAKAFPAMTMIYVIPGVVDDAAAANLGVATTVSCTNIEASARSVQFILRGTTGIVYANKTMAMPALRNTTVSTHNTAMFGEDSLLAPATGIPQGTIYVYGTSANIFCSAMIVDAASSIPNGVALHMVRRNPSAGFDE